MLTTAKTNEADQTIKAHYEIPVDLIGEQVVPHVPDHLELGKTVHYKSDDGKGNAVGEVTIKFPDGSPYDNPDGSPKIEVSSNEPPLELKREGNFMGRCSITKDGVKYGWLDPNSTAGANHDVQKLPPPH